jgi:hypothetical protein
MTSRPVWRRPWVWVLFSLALGALIVANLLPAPFSTELERVGQGRPAAVVVHDHGLVSSMELLENLGGLRPAYEERIEFLLADAHHPRGQEFMRRQGLEVVTLALFDAEGRRVGTIRGAPPASELAQALDQLLDESR